MIQGMSGVMDITGESEGPPQKIGVAFADIFTGLYSVIGIQAALQERSHTGKGQYIDMALFDCMTAVLANQAMNYLSSGTTPKRMGNMHPNICPYETVPTKDGHIIIATGNDNQFHRLCDCLKLSDIKSDPRFSDNANRVAHRHILMSIINEQTATWLKADLLEALETAVVPAGPINSIEEAFADPQLAHRDMIIDADNGVRGLRTPISFANGNCASSMGAPELGEHGNAKFKA